MELTIRPYAEADFDAVTTVWFASWASTEVGLPNPAIRAELRERLPHEIAGDWTVYVAMAGTDIVGFLALQERRFQQLFVAPTMQSRCVGKQLLDFVKAKWTLLTKVETSCDRILIAGGANVEAEWEQGPAV